MRLRNAREEQIYREAQIASRASTGSVFGTIFGFLLKTFVVLVGGAYLIGAVVELLF
jgi:hypothetical protein